MKLAKHTYIILVVLLCSITTYAQSIESALQFTTKSYDFGHIREDGGEARCVFTATNSGKSNIFITDVSTSCGCTSTKYTKEAIAPQATFELIVMFNPYNRPGRIDKHVFVTASDSSQVIKLQLKGYVQERERSVDEIYPFDMGEGLRVRSNFHAFGYIEHGDSVEEHIGYINTSNKAISIAIEHTEESGFLTIDYPTTIPAGAAGDITLCYSIPEDRSTYGTISDKLRLKSGNTEARYMISCEAIATDNFSMVDDISAPHIDISKKIIKFGEINSDKEVLEEVITVTNSGASPLKLRRIESTSEALECVASSLTLEPGESTKLRVKVYTKRITATEGLFSERLRIISNDPIRPMHSIKVNAIID